jgi:putative endonuclease
MNDKRPAVYIMANKMNGTIYSGVTSDLVRRVYEHKQGTGSSFCTKYGCKILVWYYFFETMVQAIQMEKLLKMKNRSYKIALIENRNVSWNDLYLELYHQ